MCHADDVNDQLPRFKSRGSVVPLSSKCQRDCSLCVVARVLTGLDSTEVQTRTMLPSAFLLTLAVALLSGCLAAESLYKVLGGGSESGGGWYLLNIVVGRDASDADIKKAYRVSQTAVDEEWTLTSVENVEEVSSRSQSRRGDKRKVHRDIEG